MINKFIRKLIVGIILFHISSGDTLFTGENPSNTKSLEKPISVGSSKKSPLEEAKKNISPSSTPLQHLESYEKIAKIKSRLDAQSIAKRAAHLGAHSAGMTLALNMINSNILSNIKDSEKLLLSILFSSFMSASISAMADLLSNAYKPSREWIAQLELLAENKKSINEQKLLYLGVPSDKIDIEIENIDPEKFRFSRFYRYWNKSKIRKAYLLSSTFNDISQATIDNHYELYLMPKDEYLTTLFIALNNFFQMPDYSNQIAFIGLRPTPGVTKSPFSSKNMPRIIIGFNSRIKNPQVIKDIVKELEKLKINEKSQSDISINMQPRYSQKINPLIFGAYGSADYKESVKGKEEYKNKGTSLYERLISGPSDESMAYKSNDFKIK